MRCECRVAMAGRYSGSMEGFARYAVLWYGIVWYDVVWCMLDVAEWLCAREPEVWVGPLVPVSWMMRSKCRVANN